MLHCHRVSLRISLFGKQEIWKRLGHFLIERPPWLLDTMTTGPTSEKLLFLLQSLFLEQCYFLPMLLAQAFSGRIHQLCLPLKEGPLLISNKQQPYLTIK